jgi:hypothetical protein
MHKTTRTVVKMAACGVAFAIPMLGSSSAFASSGGSSLTVNGNGVARQAANQPQTSTTSTGSSYGTEYGTAKTILLSKFGPASPSTSGYSYNDGEGYSVSSETKNLSSTGTVIAVTKTANTALISRFTGVSASCGTDKYSYTYGGYYSYTRAEDTCTLAGTGTYVARGAAVTAGLPTTGTVNLNSRQGTSQRTATYNGHTYPSTRQYDSTNLTFGNSRYDD